ncbi:MAG: DUF2851 family protein [Kiritimatiellae bacterium]|nr:DUF2851 family protein [Kiritimatiellia bacterium]
MPSAVFDYTASLSAARETHGGYRLDSHWSERHLQCVWSDRALRPALLVTDAGENVEVAEAGRWNLEAGPDFLDAVLLVGAERRRLAGDVEVHIRPSDWTQHRHAADPRYARVVAHVTFFPGALPDAALPAGALRIALRDALLTRPAFSFDDIDLSAYPHAVIPATPRPCSAALGSDPTRWRALLYAAGLHRLDLKTRRLTARVERSHNSRQVLYEEVMAALGYKQNTGVCRRLAQALPLSAWPASEAPLTHYARLLGLAGLLPPPDAAEDGAARLWLRHLWDLWWRHPAPPPAPPLVWHLHALRPSNHPARRLAAAAALFGGGQELEEIWRDLPLESPVTWFATVRRRLIRRTRMREWERRQMLTGPEGGPAGALIGESRAAAIVTNVLVPFVGATAQLPEPFFAALPPETVSAPMRATAAHLFGRDHNPALYAGHGLLQQGLLQIYADFCLNARDGCANCRLAANLEGGDQELGSKG